MSLYTFDVETLRALAHMAGVKIGMHSDANELAYGGRSCWITLTDPFDWLRGLHYLHLNAGLQLPKFITEFPMSALDEITNDAGLDAFCDLLGVKRTPPKFANMDAGYEFEGRHAPFCNRDPFAHRKHLVQSLIQAKINAGP